ncbi:unnamed protein product, partial [Brenthis ino]
MLFVLLMLSALTISSARPNEKFNGRNVITVPPNCPPGQEWINGQCRDIWLKFTTPAPAIKTSADILNGKNMITAPPNCRDGQQWINGECRDIWFKLADPAYNHYMSADNLNDRNMITAPPNCRDGQQWINGQCRDIWFKLEDPASALYTKDEEGDIGAINIVNEPNYSEGSWRNIISVPNQCPDGYKPDALGVCRRIF